MDEVAVASRAEDLLIFLACSRTLDFASTMHALEPATVERARANCVGTATLEADDTRILEAESDMLVGDGVGDGRERERVGAKKT